MRKNEKAPSEKERKPSNNNDLVSRFQDAIGRVYLQEQKRVSTIPSVASLLRRFL